MEYDWTIVVEGKVVEVLSCGFGQASDRANEVEGEAWEFREGDTVGERFVIGDREE